MRRIVLVLLLIVYSCGSWAQSGIITTIAGNGSRGYSGDGGAATGAQLHFPHGIVGDAFGNIYVTDYNNHCVRKIGTSGVITTIAGTAGSAGSSGDGGAASSAQLSYPRGIAIDNNGNLYICDAGNSCIRKINNSGVITTIAGNGSLGYSGDGGAATAAKLNTPSHIATDRTGNIYIADAGNHRIRKVDTSGIIYTIAGTVSGFSGDGGAATSAKLNGPSGVAIDSIGNVYIADKFNRRIRKINTSGVINTFAGNGRTGYSSGDTGAATNARLNFPFGVGIDVYGNVYIVDSINIRTVSSGSIKTIVGTSSAGFSGDGGVAISAEIWYPQGVTFDNIGNLYIADWGNHRIRKVSCNVLVVSSISGPTSVTAGSTITLTDSTAGGSWSSSNTSRATVNSSGVVRGISAGSVTISYSVTNSCGISLATRNITVNSATSGIITTIAGMGTTGFSGDGGAATSGRLNDPWGVAVDGSGNLYIADQYNHRIRKVSSSGIITTIAGNGSRGYSGDGGAATSARLYYPQGLAVDDSGNLYIADERNNRIRKVSSSGIITTIAGNGSGGFSGDGSAATSAQLSAPQGVAVDGSGNLYIADKSNNRIRKVSSSGIITTIAGTGTYGYSGDGGAATSAQLNAPRGLAIDGSGDLYIAEHVNSRIRKVSSTGIITTIVGTGSSGFSGDGGAATSAQLSGPQGLAVDGSGNLYIADSNNNRIRKVSTSGIITTIAGNGSAGFSGDGGAATSAMLYFPRGLAVDGSGNLYIADKNNQRIRKITACTAPTVGAITGLDSVCTASTIALTSTITGGTWSSSNTSRATVNSSGVVRGVTAGSVTISYSVTNSCGTAVATKNITVNPALTVAAITGPSSVTTGSTITLTDSTAGGTWSSSNTSRATVTSSGVVRGVSAGSVTISYSVTNSCGTSVATRIITVNSATSGIITTFAGTGTPGFSGDGGTATSAQLYGSLGVAVDGSGNVYIADYNGRIRKVSYSGIITTIAGTGTYGDIGDGGAATSAYMINPRSVAVDGSGNLYIADYDNHRIRKVSSSGIISTIAGTGTVGFSGDGGAATSARLNYPYSVVVDGSGNLYIADQWSNRIRKVSSSGIITTIAGSGPSGYSGDGGAATSARLSGPQGVAVDGSGNLYIADQGNNRIRKVSTTGIITTIAGSDSAGFSGDGGPATAAMLYYPQGLAIDGSGNLYIADYGNHRIRKVSSSGIITTIAGTSTAGFSGDGGAATSAKLHSPMCVVVDGAGNLYIADNDNHRIRKIITCIASTVSTITGPSTVTTDSTITLSDSTLGGTWSSSNTSRATVNSSGVVRGVSAGSVTISYTVSNACGTSRATKNVNVIAPANAPTFTVGAPSFTTACKNQPKIISDNIRVRDIDSGQTLTWSLYRAPRFGAANVTYTATSNRGIIRPPSDRLYTPNTNYVGNDTFMVRVTDGTYSSYITIYVTVNPTPSNPTIYGDTTLCAFASTTLTASPSGGIWYRNTSNFSVSTSGVVTSLTSGTLGLTDYITYKTAANSYGCRSSARHYITIPSMPARISITGSSVGTVGSTANYTSAISGGTWSVRDSAIAYFTTGGVANFTNAGTTIISYSASRCGTTFNATKTVSVAAAKQQGIVKQEAESTQEISVYPNPTTGELNIDLPMQQANLMLFDINGKIILMQEATSPHQQLDLSNYPKGIYMLVVAADGNKWVHRVILQ